MQGGGSFIETALIVAMLGVALVFGLTWIADWYAWKRTERAIEEALRDGSLGDWPRLDEEAKAAARNGRGESAGNTGQRPIADHAIARHDGINRT
jgi:hypothetical protein